MTSAVFGGYLMSNMFVFCIYISYLFEFMLHITYQGGIHIDRESTMELHMYDAQANAVNIDDITTNKQNRKVLRRLSNNNAAIL